MSDNERENVFSTSAMSVAAVDRYVDHSTIIQINGARYPPPSAKLSPVLLITRGLNEMTSAALQHAFSALAVRKGPYVGSHQS